MEYQPKNNGPQGTHEPDSAILNKWLREAEPVELILKKLVKMAKKARKFGKPTNFLVHNKGRNEILLPVAIGISEVGECGNAVVLTVL